MYETEKSLVNAAQTNAKAAQLRAIKLAIRPAAPSHPDVPPRHLLPAIRWESPKRHPTHYQRIRAQRQTSNSVKLPNSGIGCNRIVPSTHSLKGGAEQQ